MSRWSSVLPGRGRRSGSGSGTGRREEVPAGGANGTGNPGSGGPPVEDVDGVLLVRSVEDDSFPLDVVAEVAGAVGREEGVVTVIVGSAAGGGTPDADHWARLGALLDTLRARGTERVRLVMSGAGDDRPEQPCVARRIADAWELEVTAPDGAVLMTPGGALFVHGDSRPGCGWWRFAPGAQPRKLGRRAPVPDWEEALGAVPERTAGGCVVDRVPAGVLIRPAEAPRPALDDLCFSVPVDFERLTVLVGAPQAEDVAAEEVAAVLAGLPEAQRARARLAPGGRRDLLRLGQSVADLLATEVEVLTGLPLLDDHAPPGTPPRATLVGLDGRPSWRPFVSSVVCGPVDSQGRAPVPRPTELHPPDWILGGGERGTVRLTDRWQATVTRAGLALWAPDGGPRPGPLGPAVDPEVCAIELGMPGQPLDDSLLPALSRLLHGLGSGVRSRTSLLVRGRLLAGDGALRRLAAEHGVPNIRYVTTGRRPHPGTAPGRPGATAQPARIPPSGAMPHQFGTAVAPPTAGSGLPAPAPAVRPDAFQGSGSAAVTGVVGGPGAAEPVAPPRSRVGASVPGRPIARGEGPVPPVALPRSGLVSAPEVPTVGAATEGDLHAVGPTGAGSASPGSPSRLAEPGQAEAGVSLGGASAAPVELPSRAAEPREAGSGAGLGRVPAASSAESPSEASELREAEVGFGLGGASAAPAGSPSGAAEPGEAESEVGLGRVPAVPVRSPSGAAEPGQTESRVGLGGVSAAPVASPPEAAEPRQAESGIGPGGTLVAPASPRPKTAHPGEAEPPVGPARAVGASPVPPPEAAVPEKVEPEAAMPTASSEPSAHGRPAEGSAPAASPDGGSGAGAVRARSALVSSDGVGTRAEGERGAGNKREEGGAGGSGHAAADADAPGPERSRAVPAEPDGKPRVRGADVPAPPRAALPFVPGHISGAAERAAFRDAAAGSWEGHAAAVSRVLTRMPALRGHELEAARTDLIAAHAYLTAGEGPLRHRELIRDLRAGEGRLLPYAGCLASALRRLPSYRGVALRGGDADGPEPAIGALLQDPAPVSALAGSSALPDGAPVRYAIWSVTGRKVRQLLDRRGGSTETYEEIVFVPGTGFRVVGVRTVHAGTSVVLLRELPGNATAYVDGSEELTGLDLKAVAYLEEALAKGFRAGDDPRWPDRCSGPVGQDE